MNRNISIGVKTDPINNRYSFEWLFGLLAEEGVRFVQLGSFPELYQLDEAYFKKLGECAESFGIRIKSVFTSQRELGGFFSGDSHLEKVARMNYEKLIQVASWLGADYCGSNPGAVYRDKLHYKEQGIRCYLSHMKALMRLAKRKGLIGLTLEPMSCLAEPPATMEEIDWMLGDLNAHHHSDPHTVPVYICGDVSHGYADHESRVVHSNTDLFAHGIKHMAEFHFKNTDGIFNSTFGFSPEEQEAGIVNLAKIGEILASAVFPVEGVVGYLEISGPKLGRDYSDHKLENSLRQSIKAIRAVFDSSRECLAAPH